jgi:hypothetical protein
MKQFITKILILPTSLFMLFFMGVTTISLASGFVPPNNYILTATSDPTCGNGSTTPTGQVLQGIGNTGTDCTGSGVTKIIAGVVTILSYIIGAVSVIVLIFSGFRFLTSGGDPNKVASARSSLIYAAIGIAVAALAVFIVHAVFKTAVGIG